MRPGPLLVASVLLVALVACGDDAVSPSPDTPLDPPTTPDALVEGLERAVRDRDGDAYAALIHPSFRFRDETGIHPYELDRDQEIAVTRAMLAQSTELRFELGLGRFGPSDVPGFPPDEYQVSLRNGVVLAVTVPLGEHTETIEVTVPVRIVVGPDSTTTPPTFRLAEARALAHAPPTWGTVKSMFLGLVEVRDDEGQGPHPGVCPIGPPRPGAGHPSVISAPSPRRKGVR